MHVEAIRHWVRGISRLDDAIVQHFHSIVKFEADPHHICVQPWQQMKRQKPHTRFIMTKEEIQDINQWPKEWCITVSEENIQQQYAQSQEYNSDEENEEEDPLEDLDSE